MNRQIRSVRLHNFGDVGGCTGADGCPVLRGRLTVPTRSARSGGGRLDEGGIVADAALTGLAGERLLAVRRADPEDQEPNRPGYGTAPAAVMTRFPADLAAASCSVRGYVAELLGADDELVAALLRNPSDPSDPSASVSPPRAARLSRAPDSAHASPR
ncbi:hypothetical protein ACIA8E_28690 [Streptomyces sp. NPDC051664]|uniref:hypothetical protein n=1 Tax=Streptomyces sp. NPDC051664 TaxID=3365668 RepID=UPI003791DDA6